MRKEFFIFCFFLMSDQKEGGGIKIFLDADRSYR